MLCLLEMKITYRHDFVIGGIEFAGIFVLSSDETDFSIEYKKHLYLTLTDCVLISMEYAQLKHLASNKPNKELAKFIEDKLEEFLILYEEMV